MNRQRFRCSLWAQQGSNLRPLGEQRPVYPECSTPTDLAVRGLGVYPNAPGSTAKPDDKLTADLGRRLVDTAASLTLAALLLPFVAWVYWDERNKAGAR